MRLKERMELKEKISLKGKIRSKRKSDLKEKGNLKGKSGLKEKIGLIGKTTVKNVLIILWAAVFIWIWAGSCRRYLFEQACRVKIDCRGKGITAETVKDWGKQGKFVSLGIMNMAGWRVDGEREVLAISTGRAKEAQVICAFGAMELVEPAEVLCGRYGLAVEGDFCVLSEALSRQLFGSTATAGEWVQLGRDKVQVAGVVKKEEDFLIIPMKGGEAQQLAVEFKGRMGAEGKIRGILGER